MGGMRSCVVGRCPWRKLTLREVKEMTERAVPLRLVIQACNASFLGLNFYLPLHIVLWYFPTQPLLIAVGSLHQCVLLLWLRA